MKALLEKIQPELISLDPTELGRVDSATYEQRHQDRVAALVSVLKHLDFIIPSDLHYYKTLLAVYYDTLLK